MMWFNKQEEEAIAAIRAKIAQSENVHARWQEEIGHAIKELTTETQKCISATMELRAQLLLSDSSASLKRVEALEMWKASLMAELVKETPMGQKKKTKLWSKLRG